MKMKRNNRAIPLHLLIISSYVAVTLVMCNFLLPGIGSSIMELDNMLLQWMVGWNMHALFTDPLSILQANIFYPHDNTLLYSDLLLPQAIMAIPVTVLTGNSILAYNLLILLFYVLTAYGTYVLAHYYTKHHYASWIAGLIFGFSTYRMISLGHFQNLSIFFIPFAVLCLEKYFDTLKTRYSVGFTLLFIGQALSSWYNGAFLGFLTVFLMIMHRDVIRTHLKKIGTDFAIALVLLGIGIGPFGYAYFQFAAEQDSAYPLDLVIKRSADLGGYLIPSPYSFPHKLVSWVGLKKERWLENISFLGLGPLLLIVLAYGKKLYREKNTRIYLIGLPVFVLLSMGPALHLFDQTLKIPLPYFLIQAIPAFQFIRVISRLAVIALFCTALIAAFTIPKIQWKRRWLMWICVVLLPLSILAESYHTRAHKKVVHNVTCASIYETIEPNDVSSFIEYPAWDDPFKIVQYVFDSRCHNFTPIFNGYSGYRPPDYIPSNHIFMTFPDQLAVDFAALRGLRHAVFHTDSFNTPEKKRAELESSDAVSILERRDNDYLVELLPRDVDTHRWWIADFLKYEHSSLSTVQLHNVQQRDMIGGKGLGVAVASSLDGGSIDLPDIPVDDARTVHIALQGKTRSAKDQLTVRIVPNRGETIEKTLHLADPQQWEELAIQLPKKANTFSAHIHIKPQSEANAVWVNTALVYLSR